MNNIDTGPINNSIGKKISNGIGTTLVASGNSSIKSGRSSTRNANKIGTCSTTSLVVLAALKAQTENGSPGAALVASPELAVVTAVGFASMKLLLESGAPITRFVGESVETMGKVVKSSGQWVKTIPTQPAPVKLKATRTRR